MSGVPSILALMGLRGSGKSALGRALAGRLGRGFIDLDERTRARFGGASVTDIFAAHGEAAWRGAEVAALEEALGGPACVLALGGGTPIADGARSRLDAARRSGRLCCLLLDAAPDLLLSRRHGADDRPALVAGESVSQEIARTHRERMPVFREIADRVLAVRDEPLDTTVARALAALAPD